MNDSDWRDPFADDAAARDRAARRAERAARRREREQEARESLGERVRAELAGSGPPDDPAPEPPAAPPQAPPPGRPPTSELARHRRTIALVAVGALIVLVAGVGVVLSRSDDDGGAGAVEPRARKTISVTIPEGLDRSQVADVAKEAGVEGDYEKASKSSPGFNLKKYGAQGADSLEGFLFPATYELFKGAKVDALVDKQLAAFEQTIGEVDLTAADKAGMSVYDIVIIASMIEREIQVPEERELAASVIYNRLDAGNPLGIDATIRFEDGNWTEPLVESRLNEPTPYNTRINAGLPPGPIGNPGLASLEAAANPAETDFFYYVIKPGTCNEHTFVETEEEFAAAEAEYQAALQAEGGSPTDC